MNKLYYRTEPIHGVERQKECLDDCDYIEDIKVGSQACQECFFCYGWDNEEQWVKCLNYNMEKTK